VALVYEPMTTESPITLQDVPPAEEGTPLSEAPSTFGGAPSAGLQVSRVIGSMEGPGPGADQGPLLICVAGLHGNEPAGVLALERVFRTLRTEAERGVSPVMGRFVGLAGNLQALERRCRFVDLDLNRLWTVPYLERARNGHGAGGDGSPDNGPDKGQPASPDAARPAEDRELVELASRLGEILGGIPEARRHEVFLLDLHTASGPGPAFTVLDDTLPNREFALDLQAPVVLGIEEELDGTLMHYVSDLGFTAVGFEGGRHDDPAAVDRAEAAVWIALETSGVLPPEHPRIARSCELLAEASRDFPRVVEVLYRHVLAPGDGFRIDRGLAGFDRVKAGRVLGTDRQGSIAARESGLVLMPLYQDQGDEGFFLVRPVHPLWLSVSKAVRRLHLERLLHWLPGVRRHPELPKSFVVDRKIARWVAPELFHLLGFRRQGSAESRYLVMSRRFGDR